MDQHYWRDSDENQPADQGAVVKRSVEAIGPIAQKKRLRMTLYMPSPLPMMSLDEDRVRQVLDNE